MNTKDAADRILDALGRNPELKAEIRSRLATEAFTEIMSTAKPTTFTAWAVLAVEHEFGQRDEGWMLFASKTDAQTYLGQRNDDDVDEPARNNQEQYWSHHLSSQEVDEPVWDLLVGRAARRSGRGVHSIGKALPPRDTIITLDLLDTRPPRPPAE